MGSFPQQNAATLRSTAWYVTKPLTKLISAIVEVSECWGFAGRKDELFQAAAAPLAQVIASAAIEPREQHGTRVHACRMLRGKKASLILLSCDARDNCETCFSFGEMVTGGILLHFTYKGVTDLEEAVEYRTHCSNSPQASHSMTVFFRNVISLI